MKMETVNMRDKVKLAVEQEFHRILDEPAPEASIKFAVEDVYETSALEDEGYYSDGDITLAVRRTLGEAVRVRAMLMERQFALVPMKDVRILLAAVRYGIMQANDSDIEVLDEGTLEEQIAELQRMEAKLLAEVETDDLPEITADDLRDYQGR